jgi:phosphatidylinositol-3-phosphatase
MKAIRAQIDRAIAGAASLTGKRFGLLVASSLVATSAIVAAALTTPGGNGPLAALLGRSLASDQTPVEAPVAEPALAGEGGGGGGSSSGSSESSSGPIVSGEPSAPLESSEEPLPEAEEEETTPTVPSAPTPEAGQIKHVFIVSVTSPGYEAAFGAAPTMPYLAGALRPQGELLSNYKLLGAAGLPNRIAAVAGQPPNTATTAECSTYSEFSGAEANSQGVVSGSGCVYPVETLSFADQLGGARFSWHGYFDGMADPVTGKADNCVRPEAEGADAPAPGGYAASRNPFVYFHSLLDLGDCSTNDLPLSELEADLGKIETTPNYSYISPTPCEAGTVGTCLPAPAGAPPTVEGAAAADAFLAEWVPKILKSPAYKKNGLLIVAFDQANPEVNPADPVGALLLSRYVSKGATDAVEYDPYSLLKSSEDLFGLSYLAKAGSVKVRSFGLSLRGGETGSGD